MVKESLEKKPKSLPIEVVSARPEWIELASSLLA